MIGRIGAALLKSRRRLSRSEWMVRLLGLSKAKGTEAELGIVLIQIDGLSRPQLEKALQNRRLPFMNKLMRKEAYALHTVYTGLPSNTPSFQGELFYGVRRCVPAFSFRDRETGTLMRMYEPAAAARVQEKLEKEGEGLLQGGSAYANIFSGSAAESAFCPATLSWSKSFRGANPFSLVVFVLLNAWSFIRVGVLLLLECALSLTDFVRGLIEGQDLWKELRFVPARVGVSILLRELVAMNAMIDAARGLPIIHLNFVGYDEQAHRRGPSSAFAHWTLKGIDDAVKRVWKAAKRSGRRDYEVWVYSDHGQEEAVPYEMLQGQSIEAAVSEIFDQPHRSGKDGGKGEALRRVAWLGLPKVRWFFGAWIESNASEGEETLVAAMGPVGHVYPARSINYKEGLAKARDIVEKAKVPMVALKGDSDAVFVLTEDGLFNLPEDAEAVFGADHPYIKWLGQDMAALCRHPESGDFVLFGWSKKGRFLSFPGENGAHGGPGPNETTGFALLPTSAPILLPEGRPLRARDLREGVLQLMGKSPGALPWRRRRRQRPRTLRVMTYNVHSCMGMDGKLSPERIARVIAQFDPDVVALQELDVGRRRTEQIDQAEVIARILEMEFHFHPALQMAEEKYGNAVLSRYPLRFVQAETLPAMRTRKPLEPRGALWVAVAVKGLAYQIMNTHLGLSRRERLLHCETLLGPDWLGQAQCRGPVILCGDFNAPPRSAVCRKFKSALRDAQDVLHDHRPRGTWFGRYPIQRIDHVFIDRSQAVHSVQVPRTALTRSASDHLPLIVDLDLP